ncbi:hypothetical protein Pelo_7896 [Pelomyxa schiedti]|nr:hypothetical protein Pelo_7896 [Pelomyxa schiedti]
MMVECQSSAAVGLVVLPAHPEASRARNRLSSLKPKEGVGAGEVEATDSDEDDEDSDSDGDGENTRSRSSPSAADSSTSLMRAAKGVPGTAARRRPAAARGPGPAPRRPSPSRGPAPGPAETSKNSQDLTLTIVTKARIST